MKQVFTLLFLTMTFFVSLGQTLEELKKQKADLVAKAAPIQAQADAILSLIHI